MSKFTEGPFSTMANMPESVCKKNEDGSLRWGCRVRPFIGYEVCSDESARRKECVTVAMLFRAAPDLLAALEQQLAQWQLIANMVDTDNDEVVSAAIEASMCMIGIAIRKARGEE